MVVGALLAYELPQFLWPSNSGETVWQLITDGINADGSVPARIALEEFAYDFRVDVPGVVLPRGVEGADAPTSATGIVQWLQADWAQLTPDQRAVVNRYITPSPGDVVVPAGSPSAEGPTISLTAAHAVAPPIARVGNDPAPGLEAAMYADVIADVSRIGQDLGVPVIQEQTVPVLAFPFTFSTIELTLSQESGGNALMLTYPVLYKDLYSPCHITAYREAWSGEQVTSGGGVSPRLHVLLTHEVVHCYQYVEAQDLEPGPELPQWITEGTAMYLAAIDTGIAEPIMSDMWTKGYVGRPDKALAKRTYDAYGYYALLSHQGRDLWSVMASAWRAAFHAQDEAATFIAALGGDNPDVLDNWAESYLRSSDWGDPWQMYGFGLPAAAAAPQDLEQAGLAPGLTGQLPGMSNRVVNITASAGEVLFIETDGTASVHDGYGNSEIAFQSGRFCVTGDCVCPQGTVLAGQDMAAQDFHSQNLTVPFVAAFNAGQKGSTYSVFSDTLADLCKHGATPKPQPRTTPNYGPCGSGCSNSNGDPHLLTINGYRYDFQAAGEFTLLRSPDGSLEIQGRQEPWQGSTTVSINTAVAARVGTHRVGVYVTGSGLQARVDGQVADVSAGAVDLGGGASLAGVSKGFEVIFPDGTAMWALSVGEWGINVQVKPSRALSTTGQGLLGEVVPGGMGVPSLPDGTRLPAATDASGRFAVLYGQFADAWRVSDATSLFDYDSGRTTATYTIRPFPGAPRALADLSAGQQAAGDASCAAITDQALHDQCVFDVGETGDAGFAGSYAAVAAFYDSGISTATPAPVASTTPAAGLVSGAWQVVKATAVTGFTLAPNDIVYANVQTGDNTFSLMAIDPVGQKIVAQVSVPAGTEVHYAAGSVWLPALRTDSQGHQCSVTRFDGGTLAEQATIDVPCGYFGHPEMASDGDAMWYVDVSKYDLGTGKGASMVRLDPQSNSPGASVALPFINGYRVDSQGALFYYGTDKTQGYYRLTTGSTAFDSIVQTNATARPAGAGLWVDTGNGKGAALYTAPGSPQTSLQTGGSLLAGDAKAAYVDVPGTGAQGQFEDQLWRFPVDGSTPAQIASSPTIDGQPLSYFGDPMPVSNGDGVLKIWTQRLGSDNQATLIMQWVATP